jgi:radical SAM protein with 4Fe4S-binding SPASM domain
MSFDHIVAELKKQYSVIDTIYLSDFLKNGNQWLHQRLTLAYRTAYSEKERILVVQDCNDTYDYENFPGQAVLILQKYASQIDISNSFILMVSTNELISNELEEVQRLYSTDKFPIQSYIVDGPKFQSKQTYSTDTFCVLPWMHLYIGPDGNVLPCCRSDRDFSMGNIQATSILDIAKSDQFNRLRSNMINGKRSKECSSCYVREDAGLTSSREIYNLEWQQVDASNLNPDGTIESFNPVYFDIRLNNVCNLKCRMCD